MSKKVSLSLTGSKIFADLRGSQWAFSFISRSRRQEGRYDFECEIVLVSVASGTPLKIANLVVEHVPPNRSGPCSSDGSPQERLLKEGVPTELGHRIARS